MKKRALLFFGSSNNFWMNNQSNVQKNGIKKHPKKNGVVFFFEFDFVNNKTSMADFDLNALEAELAKLRGEVEDLPNAIQEELEQIPALEKELADLNGEAAKELSIGKQVSTNRSQLQEEVERLREQYAELSARGGAGKREHQEAVATRDELQSKIQEASERLQAGMAEN